MTTSLLAPVKTPFDPEGRLHFDEITHRYWLDERGNEAKALLSVTHVLEAGLQGTMGEEYWTQEARTRGKHIHQAILYHAEGDLAAESVSDLIRPYFLGYLKFIEHEHPETIFVEQRVFDEPLGYAGTFDLLVQLRGPNAHRDAVRPGVEVLDLIDVKTGGLPWWVMYQLAAYRRRILVAMKNVLVRSWALQLTARGTYRLCPMLSFPGVRSADSERDFLSILRVAQLKRLHARHV